MDIESIREICSKMKAVTEDIKWENHLCFSVGEKMFLVLGLDQHPTSASFKVSEEDFEELCQMDGFKQAPYFAKKKWVHTDDISRLNSKEWLNYTQKSYDLVKVNLTKKLQKELGILT